MFEVDFDIDDLTMVLLQTYGPRRVQAGRGSPGYPVGGRDVVDGRCIVLLSSRV